MTKEEIKEYIDSLFASKGLNQEFILEFTKVRNVKTPQKSYDAAGWDFYVPENLNITDFTKNVGIYTNENLVKKQDIRSPKFLLKNKNDQRELWIQFYKDSDGSIKYINCNSGLTIIEEWNHWIENKDTVVTSIDLEFGEKILIPSGIHVNLPKNVYLKVENKSGIASKRGLLFGSSVIDQDYTGEMHINLINVCDNIAIINAGDKIVQMLALFQPIMSETKEYSTTTELYANKQSERGADGFGSTDKK